MMDFQPRPSAAFAEAFEALIDAAMQAENAAQEPRTYLGASRLGEECLRKLGYEFHRSPKDEGREFKGRTLRIFERGHLNETAMARRLKLAGFKMVTERADGGQIGFVTGNGKIAGHLDGVLTAGPAELRLGNQVFPLRYPMLWENKCLGDKAFKDLKRQGVRASKPVYFVQKQLYMAYLDLSDNPALITVENGNDGELYAEQVGFDQQAAQAASDKGARVVSTTDPEELPRIASKATDFRCKMCDYPGRCWRERDAFPALTAEGAAWSFGANG